MSNPAPQTPLPPEVLAEMRSAVAAIRDGYPTELGDSAIVVVENPKFKPDEGSAPNLVIDLGRLLSELESSRRQIEALKAPVTEGEVAEMIARLQNPRLMLDGEGPFALDGGQMRVDAETAAALLSRLSGERKTMEAERDRLAAKVRQYEWNGRDIP